MQAGKLRHVVTLRRATESQNAAGEIVQSWADLATVRAEIVPLTGRELLDAKQIDAEMNTRIVIRTYAGLTEKDRVIWTDPGNVAHDYDIRSVAQDLTHQRQMTLLCAEVTS